jgi:hypothetical protein
MCTRRGVNKVQALGVHRGRNELSYFRWKMSFNTLHSCVMGGLLLTSFASPPYVIREPGFPCYTRQSHNRRNTILWVPFTCCNVDMQCFEMIYVYWMARMCVCVCISVTVVAPHSDHFIHLNSCGHRLLLHYETIYGLLGTTPEAGKLCKLDRNIYIYIYEDELLYRPALGPTQPPVQWVSWTLTPEVKRP